jgi:hypothetical protein
VDFVDQAGYALVPLTNVPGIGDSPAWVFLTGKSAPYALRFRVVHGELRPRVAGMKGEDAAQALLHTFCSPR